MITFILLITVVFVLVVSGFAICNSRPRKLYQIKWKCVMGTTHFDVVRAKDQPDAYRRFIRRHWTCARIIKIEEIK